MCCCDYFNFVFIIMVLIESVLNFLSEFVFWKLKLEKRMTIWNIVIKSATWKSGLWIFALLILDFNPAAFLGQRVFFLPVFLKRITFLTSAVETFKCYKYLYQDLFKLGRFLRSKVVLCLIKFFHGSHIFFRIFPWLC